MKISNLFLAGICAAAPCVAVAAATDFVQDGWSVRLNSTHHTITLSNHNQPIVAQAMATAITAQGDTLKSALYPQVKLSKSAVTTAWGKGTRYTYRYSGLNGAPDMMQSFYFYPSLPYMLVEGAVEAEGKGIVEVYNLCPLVSETAVALPLPTSDNKVYNMPFANDNWATYNAEAWTPGKPVTSCEATALFNAADRKGIVIGSVDHSEWKSAITVTPEKGNVLGSFKLEAGYIGIRTWDVVPNKATSLRHGAVKGHIVNSPLFMVGVFSDWRTGLETYGEANTVLCPKYEWTKDSSLFGWQSWGGMAFGLNYKSAMSLLDFFAKELLPVGFKNREGRCHIVLDSGWNALNDEQLAAFVARCKELGCVPGIYTTPFSYWGGEDAVAGNSDWEGGKLGEMVLKTEGKYRHIVGWSLDPTHPAVKEWNRKTFQKFRDLGFEFVKIDFMNNGSQEADSWYLPEITTGMQAYNYGLDYIKEFAGDMMLDFSIAPVFPAKAHVRRIGCDAWGRLNQSMYTLNCINGSWWLDRVYAFNDPDHMCLSPVPVCTSGSVDEQESRIRYTCGLITGMTLMGGTYAYDGDEKMHEGKPTKIVGSDAERELAARICSNADLTEVGRIGRTFRPVEGRFEHLSTLYHQNDVMTDNEFIYDTPEAFYYVVFNYGDNLDRYPYTPNYDRLGIAPSDFTSVKELWTGTTHSLPTFQVDVPTRDVRIYRFARR